MENSKKQSYSIKDWAEADRPREKLLLKGRRALTDAELVAILIGSGNREDSAVSLAQKMLTRFDNNLNNLAQCSLADLQQFKGIGEAKAISVAAALELGRRRQATEISERQTITLPKDVFDLLNPVIGDLPHEEFWIIYLNNAKKIIKKECISTGGLTSTTVDVRLVLKKAIEAMATSIVVAHNHPTGRLVASKADVALTKKIKTACELIDISFDDHVIIGNQQYFSFLEKGYLG